MITTHHVFAARQRADPTSPQPSDNEAQRDADVLDGQSFYSISSTLQYAAAIESPLGPSVHVQGSDWSSDWWRDSAASSILGQTTPSSTPSAGYGRLIDMLSPGLPPRETRFVDMGLRNPYADSGQHRNPVRRASRYKLAGNAVNGYVKFRLRPAHDAQQHQTRPSNPGLPFSSSVPLGLAMQHRQKRRKTPPTKEKISYIPRDFGSVSKLDGDDWKLFKFCRFRELSFLVF